jgi:hypothetical protein
MPARVLMEEQYSQHMLIAQKAADQGQADPMLHQSQVVRFVESLVVVLAENPVVMVDIPVVVLAENPVVRPVYHIVEKAGPAEVQEGAGYLALT